MYFHPLNDSLPILNKVYGRDFVIIAKPEPNDIYIKQRAFEIAYRRSKLISKTDNPCNYEEDINMQACINKFIELEAGCSLPWSNLNPNLEICNDSLVFKRIYGWLMSADELKISKLTGCHQPCQFTV